MELSSVMEQECCAIRGNFEFWDDLEYIHYIYVLNLSTHGEVLELILKQVCISSESSLCKTNYENRKKRLDENHKN